ncbi:MAG: hypothetical protein R3B72_23730 [Polyangiaceae bacterium]
METAAIYGAVWRTLAGCAELLAELDEHAGEEPQLTGVRHRLHQRHEALAGQLGAVAESVSDDDLAALVLARLRLDAAECEAMQELTANDLGGGD